MLNNRSNFGDFVRFHPLTYKRTQQSLPPLISGNKTEILNNSKIHKRANLISVNTGADR